MRFRSGLLPPPPFEAASRRIERWRRTQEPGSRLPEELWKIAVRLAREHGVSPTARALRVGYYALRRRVEATSSKGRREDRRRGEGAGFLTLPLGLAAPPPGCVLELEDRARARLRIELRGAALSEVGALVRTLWRGSR